MIKEPVTQFLRDFLPAAVPAAKAGPLSSQGAAVSLPRFGISRTRFGKFSPGNSSQPGDQDCHVPGKSIIGPDSKAIRASGAADAASRSSKRLISDVPWGFSISAINNTQEKNNGKALRTGLPGRFKISTWKDKKACAIGPMGYIVE
jgi:hypothetical protein